MPEPGAVQEVVTALRNNAALPAARVGIACVAGHSPGSGLASPPRRGLRHPCPKKAVARSHSGSVEPLSAAGIFYCSDD
jgi:hypothetical protein